jgi:SAM-dependent methyltransferase
VSDPGNPEGAVRGADSSARFSDRWIVRAPGQAHDGSGDVVDLLRRAANYIDSLGPVTVTDVVLRREHADADELLVLTVSFDHAGLPADLEYLDPRTAAAFDDDDGPRPDFDFVLGLAADVQARTIIDLGCGTGRLATYLAGADRRVIGVDPAPAMIDVARARAAAELVEWRIGDARTLGTPKADLVVMTGNISGYIVEDTAWDECLSYIRAALRPGGHLTFGSRTVDGRAWERWNGAGMEVLGVHGDRVRVDGYISFEVEKEELVAGSEYRFRTPGDLEASLARAGFIVVRRFGDWLQSPLTDTSEEVVYVAQAARDEGPPPAASRRRTVRQALSDDK